MRSILPFILFALSLPISAFAGTQVECTVKRLDEVKKEYEEMQLKGGTSQGGIFSARGTLSDCQFQAQSHRPEQFLQVYIQQSPQSDGISTYSGYDPKGYVIVSLSKNEGKFICMLVCSKKQ